MYITNENADRLVDMLNAEITNILGMGNGMTKEAVCLLGEIVDILKDVKEIDMEMGQEGGMNSYNYGGSYGRGSYNNGGYSSRYNNGGYSSRRGRMSMSSERDHILSKMDHFMNQATNENERELIRRIMDSI